MHAVNERRDQHIHADRLTGTGRSGNKQVGHFGEIGDIRLAGGCLSQCHGKTDGWIVELFGREYISTIDHLRCAIRDLHANRRFPRNWRDDADALGFKRKGQVVGEINDLINFDPDSRFELIASDDRAGELLYWSIDVYVKSLKCIFKRLGGRVEFILGDRSTGVWVLLQQVERRIIILERCYLYRLRWFSHCSPATRSLFGRFLEKIECLWFVFRFSFLATRFRLAHDMFVIILDLSLFTRAECPLEAEYAFEQLEWPLVELFPRGGAVLDQATEQEWRDDCIEQQ